MRSKRIEEILSGGRISALLGILSLSDEEAYNHAIAVAEIVDEYLLLAKENNELEWNEEECTEIVMGALLHDIGKAFLPFGLQYSSHGLSKYELEVMRTHPLLGRVAIKNCHFSEIIKNIVLMHHANADGSGYPVINMQVFDKTNVPEYVWLVAYADRFEAMTNNRSFKQAMSYPEAWKELLNMSRKEILPYKYTRLFGEIIKKKSILSIENIDKMEEDNEFSQNRE